MNLFRLIFSQDLSNYSDSDLLTRFRSENWENLNKGRKMDTMREIVERDVLSRNSDTVPHMGWNSFLDEDRVGVTWSSTGDIDLNPRYKDNPYQMLHTSYHEGDHYVQYKSLDGQCIGQYSDAEKTVLGTDFEMYVGDSPAYTNQMVEIDANNHAFSKIWENKDLFDGDPAFEDYLSEQRKYFQDRVDAFDHRYSNGISSIDNDYEWALVHNSIDDETSKTFMDYLNSDDCRIKNEARENLRNLDEYFNNKENNNEGDELAGSDDHTVDSETHTDADGSERKANDEAQVETGENNQTKNNTSQAESGKNDHLTEDADQVKAEETNLGNETSSEANRPDNHANDDVEPYKAEKNNLDSESNEAQRNNQHPDEEPYRAKHDNVDSEIDSSTNNEPYKAEHNNIESEMDSSLSEEPYRAKHDNVDLKETSQGHGADNSNSESNNDELDMSSDNMDINNNQENDELNIQEENANEIMNDDLDSEKDLSKGDDLTDKESQNEVLDEQDNSELSDNNVVGNENNDALEMSDNDVNANDNQKADELDVPDENNGMSMNDDLDPGHDLSQSTSQAGETAGETVGETAGEAASEAASDVAGEAMAI